MPTAKDHLSPSCFSLHAQNVIRLLFNKKRTIDHCISSYYKISSCNESISTRRSSSKRKRQENEPETESVASLD